MVMRMLTSTLILALTPLAPAGAALHEQRRGDQMRAYEALREGRILPSREIIRRVSAQMPGWQYIGFDFDAGSGVYTLKFLRDGKVIWVDVDGRSGQVIGRTGN